MRMLPTTDAHQLRANSQYTQVGHRKQAYAPKKEATTKKKHDGPQTIPSLHCIVDVVPARSCRHHLSPLRLPHPLRPFLVLLFRRRPRELRIRRNGQIVPLRRHTLGRLLSGVKPGLHLGELVLDLLLLRVGDAAVEQLGNLLLVREGLGVLAHHALDALNAAHLGLDILEHARALLQPEHDVLLYERELDVGRQVLQLGELGVRLGEQGLLVLLAAQGEQGLVLVALGEHLLCDGRLLVGQEGDALLVLVELVALELHVEDVLVLRRDFAAVCAHFGV
ncbi:hypothetical protein VDGD_21129 [Verticillium dahliae]|nr:hypothetical protein VDGD_21129 [Verticillium dahliae]